ncbi:hypothetical protein YPPY25_3019, partial [Yersinia pestis PY-25]
MTTAA